MKEIFTKTDFPSAPGGNIYHWKDEDTTLDVPKDGKYIIEITASAKNAAQNNSSDDDDLRVAIDDYEFGREEIHEDKISWKGFGVAASWDGASLQGGSKTVYFFMSLSAGQHTIQFWVDETPTIESVRVHEIDQNEDDAIEDAIFDFNETALGHKTDVSGIPWKAFVFAPGFNIVKLIDITASAQSGKQKGSTDGDNIKVYINGQIVHNPKAPTSNKYKNFFFSGDISQGKKEALMIPSKDFLINDQDVSVEIWYDETPILEKVKIELNSDTEYTHPNTFQRRIANFNELSNLPINISVHWITILRSVSRSRNLALQYAEDNAFTETGEDGELRRLIEDNEPDAFRHFVWSAILTREIDEQAAEIVTTQHELYGMELLNKRELSKTNVMDLWNNKQGREYTKKHPQQDYSDLFKTAKSEDVLILNLEDVTQEHRKEVENIINQYQ